MISHLLINRFIVIKKDGTRAYDEQFHAGLNIIRGDNGSGKSSICDLIFYALGGDLEKWKSATLNCQEVIIELLATGKTITVKRDISSTRQRPLRIFYGSFDDSNSSSADGWHLHPIARDEENTQSFSQIMFKALGIPEIPGDNTSNITMHQILRIMYSDQMSPLQKIYRNQRWDSRETREAVAELLLGIGDFELYKTRLKHRATKKDYDVAESHLSNLLKALSAFKEDLSRDSVEQNIKNIEQNKSELYQALSNVESSKIKNSDIAKESEKKRRETYDKLTKVRSEIISLEQNAKSLNYDIEDSADFIKHLESMLTEFDSSALAYFELGGVQFELCPACFTELPKAQDGHCKLCGSETSDSDAQSKALALRVDIEGQIQESKTLQEARQLKVKECISELSSLRRTHSRLTNQLDEFKVAPVDGVSARVSEISRQIGMLDGRLSELDKLKGISEEISEYSDVKKKLAGELSDLRSKIEALETARQRRRQSALTEVRNKTIQMLELDLKEHNDFEEVQSFNFSFEDDWFAINGEPNISTSASGMVVAKNSLFLGILLASDADEKMRFPHFLLMDNVEDKGMVDPRIHHLQETIATESSKLKHPHQIIVTTSHINPTLNTEQYVVGPHYTKKDRTLK